VTSRQGGVSGYQSPFLCHPNAPAPSLDPSSQGQGPSCGIPACPLPECPPVLALHSQALLSSSLHSEQAGGRLLPQLPLCTSCWAPQQLAIHHTRSTSVPFNVPIVVTFSVVLCCAPCTASWLATL